MLKQPDFDEFSRRCQGAELASLAACLEFDCLSMLALALAMKDEPFFFLLESANSDKTFSRFSFCGYQYRHLYYAHEDRLFCDDQPLTAGNPYSQLFSRFQQRQHHGSPLFEGFQGGLVGALAYDSVNYMGELRQEVSPVRGEHSFDFIEVDRFFVFDNYLQRCYAVVVVDAATPAESYAQGLEILTAMSSDLHRRLAALLPQACCLDGLLPGDQELRTRLGATPEELYAHLVERDMDDGLHQQKIVELAEELAAGEAIQANLSVRFALPAVDSFLFYRHLRRINPSPYMFYLRWRDRALVGASPEIHLRVHERQATIKPLAGTRPRDGRPLDVICRELLADEKERAEHLMLIDLARNDLFTSCEPESVIVRRPYTPEVYSHVIHITSEVQGRLKSGIAPWQLFARTFPAGTLTGAPRVRAIELLEECEASARGFYGGCIGYFNYNGDINTAITIRSAFFADGKSFYRAGGGIVVDSKSDYEAREVERKAVVVRQMLLKSLAQESCR